MRKLSTALLLCCFAFVSGGVPAIAAEKKPSNLSKATKSSKASQSTPTKKKAAATQSKTKKTAAKSTNQKKNLARNTNKKQKPATRTASIKPRSIWQDGPLALQSGSVLVVDQLTGKPLLAKNPGAIQPIASISKLMTAMVVLDAGLDLNEVIEITDEDVDYLKNTRSHLQVGSTMSRETALLLALMSSENRAAHALGRHYPGGMHNFVAAMNRKAHSLGMNHTRFEEPTGLSRNNVSTAQDLAVMVAAAHQYPKIREFSTTAKAEVDLGDRIREFGNTNVLVKSEQWQIGLSKTGYISEAGRCLVMQSWVAEKPVIIVLLDSSGKMTRVGDANRIKDWMENPRGLPAKSTGS